MTLITDGLLIVAAIFAGTYCFVLARRVRALKDLDSGLGSAIMRMTGTLEDARRALEDAKSASRDSNRDLKDLVARAEAASGHLLILLSATRDLPQKAPQPAPECQVVATPASTAPPPSATATVAEKVATSEPLSPPSTPVPASPEASQETAAEAPATAAPANDPVEQERAQPIPHPLRASYPLWERAASLSDSEDDFVTVFASPSERY